MSKFIGRKFNIGIGKESVRATPVVASYWLPKVALDIDDKIEFAVNESSIGVIEDAVGQSVTKKYAEGSIEGLITDKGIGLLLMALFGTDTVGAVETGVKDHAFTVLQSAQHPSLTLSIVEANSNSGSGFAHALAMIDSLEITLEVGKFASYKASFRANAGADQADTVAFTAENIFKPQDCVFKMASALAGLSGASAINARKIVLTLKANTEDDDTIGSVASVDRLNKQFSVDGSVELVYNDRTFIDTDMLADLAQAIRLQAINTAVTIGSTSNPTLTFDLASAKIQEVARKIENNGIIMQTVKFKGYYSQTDSSMVTATLRNTVTSAY